MTRRGIDHNNQETHTHTMNAETVVRQDQVAELIDRLATAERQRDAALDALRQIDDEDGRQFFLPANIRKVYRAALENAK